MIGAVPLLSSVCATAAGIAAYLTTYEEYRQHFTNPQRVWRQSLRTAIVAALVFLVCRLIAMALFSWVMA